MDIVIGRCRRHVSERRELSELGPERVVPFPEHLGSLGLPELAICRITRVIFRKRPELANPLPEALVGLSVNLLLLSWFDLDVGAAARARPPLPSSEESVCDPERDRMADPVGTDATGG